MPQLARVGRADVVLKVRPGRWTVYPLKTNGMRRSPIPCKVETGRLHFVADIARDKSAASFEYELTCE